MYPVCLSAAWIDVLAVSLPQMTQKEKGATEGVRIIKRSLSLLSACLFGNKNKKMKRNVKGEEEEDENEDEEVVGKQRVFLPVCKVMPIRLLQLQTAGFLYVLCLSADAGAVLACVT